MTTLAPSATYSPASVLGRSRAWAGTGIAAGLTGAVSIFASMTYGAPVYEEDHLANGAATVDALADDRGWLVVFHTATMATVLLLLVFAAGLKRRLEEQAPVGSLLPNVAAWGLLLVSVAGLMGSALDTEFLFGLGEDEGFSESNAMFFGHWVGTVPWLWAGAGVTALAVGIAALKHDAAPRWIGWVSLVLGGIITAFGVSPLQYMAGFFAPVWLFVAALGFTLGERSTR
ncbi:hypothetical protein [Sporichthya polymorpha]|uniref:hypothetical protein n=1 Tax=Sporichthya polymorpha TaxID=35751 RepID=UPI00036FA913|nr:hypothetical protein [Sporichthya polymorpha]